MNQKIYEIHHLKSPDSFNAAVNALRVACGTEYTPFFDYFKSSWIDSPFCHWRLYDRPCSVACTNSGIESINAQLKDHTNRVRKSILPCIRLLESFVTSDGERKRLFGVDFIVNNTGRLYRKASKLVNAHFSTAFNAKIVLNVRSNGVDQETYEFFNEENRLTNTFTSSRNGLNYEQECSCIEFYKCGVCAHSVAANLFNPDSRFLVSYGLETFVRRGRFNAGRVANALPALQRQ